MAINKLTAVFILKKILLGVFLFVVFTGCGKDNSTGPETPSVSGPARLHTSGRWILDDQENKVMLRGVNIASMEWTSRGENMLQSLEVAVTDWGCNLLRIPLSQDRWFGHAPEQNDGGKAYRRLVDALVDAAAEEKVYLLLELHWNNAGEWGKYIGQHKMPDVNSQTFLEELGKTYAGHPSVWIGLYNEPHDVSWDIWRDGGEISYRWDGADHNLTFQAIGHQQLYDAVKRAGASDNIIVISGLNWGYDLSGLLQGYAIDGENIVYDTHPYPWKDNYDENFVQPAREYPVLVGEWGGRAEDGHQNYGIQMAYTLRKHKLCWTAWCFHPTAGPSLIKNWNYEPTWFGTLVLSELNKPVDMTADDG